MLHRAQNIPTGRSGEDLSFFGPIRCSQGWPSLQADLTCANVVRLTADAAAHIATTAEEGREVNLQGGDPFSHD